MSTYLDMEDWMQIQDTLDEVIGHKTRTKILRILCKDSAGWTGRQLAKALGVSPTTANKLLRGLVDEGILNMKVAGRSYLYSMDDKNYLVKNLLKPFFEKEEGIFSSVLSLIRKTLVRTKVKIRSCAIFGSVAQKMETAKSDIDILIIIDGIKDKKKVEYGLDEIANTIAHDFQKTISPYILSVNQIKERYNKKAPIVKEILRSYILIMGAPIERIIV